MKNNLICYANAKVNLHLEVLGKREDGYHNISSVFRSVSLKDRLEITLNCSKEILVISENTEIAKEDNLVFLAAKRFFEATGLPLGAKINLEKNIPLSAGLGGGSADAAATLVALNKMTDFPLCDEKLEKIALELGADVPFCLYGGTKKAEGLGEKLTDITPEKEAFVVLIKHHKKQSTGYMYGLVDAAPPREKVTEKIVLALESGNDTELKKYARNDFLSVSKDKEEQGQIIEVLYEMGAFLAGLSGSGPTVFGLFDKEPSKDMVLELKKLYKEVYLCKTAVCGIEFE